MNIQLERVQLQRSMEQDLGISFSSEFSPKDRAIIWKKDQGLGYTSQAVIDSDGNIIHQCPRTLTNQEEAYYLFDEVQITAEEVDKIRVNHLLSWVGPFFGQRALVQKMESRQSRGNRQRGSVAKYNFITPRGEMISQEWFSHAESFSGGLGLVQRDGDQAYNFIRPDGTLLFEPWLYKAYSLSGRYTTIQPTADSRFQFLDGDGPLDGKEYELIHPFSEGKALVREGKKHNFLDQNFSPLLRDWLAPVREIDSFHCGFALVRRSTGAYNYLRYDGAWLFRDQNGRKKDLHLCGANAFNGGFALVTDRVRGRGTVSNFMTPEGSFLTKEWFLSAQLFKEGFALVKRKNGLFNLINHNGDFMHPEGYANANPFCDGLAMVSTVEEPEIPRFVDKSGQYLEHEPLYSAEDFSSGRSMVRVAGSNGWNFLTLDGNLLLKDPVKVDSDRYWLRPQSFRDGLARIPGNNDSHYYLNWYGEVMEDRFF